MIDNDFEWAAANRERILAEWQTPLRQQERAEELSAGIGRGGRRAARIRPGETC